MRGITLFSKNSGVEVIANDIVKKNFKYGAITLRFFKLENGGTPIKFIMSPVESYAASLMITKVVNSKEAIKLKKTHKFEREGKEIETTLTLEKWAKNDKTGYAVSIKRDNTSINVPMDTNTFMYLGELLKYFSTQQAWVNLEPAIETTEPTAEEEDIFEDIPTTPEPIDEPEDPEPTATQANDNTVTGVIEAVRKDKKGFKLENGGWFSVNDNTKLSTTLKRGERVKVEYREGNSGILFANVVSAL